MITRIAAVLTLLVVAGCASQGGTIVGVKGPVVGSTVPDVTYVSNEGKQTTFNKARYGVAVVAFTTAPGATCCWLNPKVVQLADQVWDLPVTVAQILIPENPCPHGNACMETCYLHKAGLMALCDGGHILWDAYGKPKPGTLVLIDSKGKVIESASLDASGPLMARAKQMGKNSEEKPAVGDRRDVF